jgi:hypothetical protein
LGARVNNVQTSSRSTIPNLERRGPRMRNMEIVKRKSSQSLPNSDIVVSCLLAQGKEEVLLLR